jgi:DNA-binding transcriptional LysR family regulator
LFTDIKKLRTFVAIAEEGSFTGAAERLHMAQPWVSVQLKHLEELLDLVLVERSKGKLIKLSPNGKDFLPIARRLLAACEHATEEIDCLRDHDQSKLVLGIDPITLYMPERNELIKQFMTQVPETDLQIASEAPCNLFEGLEKGRFDLILTSCPAPDDIEILPLYDYELQFFVPRGYAKDYGPRLDGVKMLSLPDNYHPAIFAWLKAELAPYNVQWVDCPELSFEALIRYARMLGLATVLPDFSANLAELREEMVLKSFESRPSLTVRWALMRRDGYRRKAPEAFWKMAANSRRSALRHAA